MWLLQSNWNIGVKNIHYGDIHQKFNNILDVNKEKLPYIKSDIKIKVNIHNNNFSIFFICILF